MIPMGAELNNVINNKKKYMFFGGPKYKTMTFLVKLDMVLKNSTPRKIYNYSILYNLL